MINLAGHFQYYALMQEIWPSRNVGKAPWRSLQPLSPWVIAMFSGASCLTDVSVGIEMLLLLPSSRRKALKSLCVDARDNEVMRIVLQAVMDCQQLRSLTIVCHTCASDFRPWGLEISELDLRHLVHLGYCHLKCVRVPGKMLLSQGELELTMLPDQVASWRKLCLQVQALVISITIEGFPYSLPISLQGWPLGIDAFHGVQFLRLNCATMASRRGGALDLALIAYIPHVSLYSTDQLIVRISKGSCKWKVLEIKSEGVFSVLVEDATSFLRAIGVFYFKYPVMDYSELPKALRNPAGLSKQLRKAGEVIEKPVLEYNDASRLGDGSFEPPMMVLSNCQPGCNIENDGFLSARLKFATGSMSSDQLCEGGFASWCP